MALASSCWPGPSSRGMMGSAPPAPPLLCPLSILLLPHKVAGAGCQANRIQQRRLILVEVGGGGCRCGEEHQQRW